MSEKILLLVQKDIGNNCNYMTCDIHHLIFQKSLYSTPIAWPTKYTYQNSSYICFTAPPYKTKIGASWFRTQASYGDGALLITTLGVWVLRQ